MVVNKRSMWGCEFYAYGRRVYVLQGFLTLEACEDYVNIMCRDIPGERVITKGVVE